MVIHPGRKAKQNGNINEKILIKCLRKSKTFSDCKVIIKQIWDLKLKLSATKDSTHVRSMPHAPKLSTPNKTSTFPLQQSLSHLLNAPGAHLTTIKQVGEMLHQAI